VPRRGGGQKELIVAVAAVSRPRSRLGGFLAVQIAVAVLVAGFVVWRLVGVLQQDIYGPEAWLRFAVTGVVIGSVYSLVAVGYTLVYGILFMINFAHGEVMMLGAFAGYFVLEVAGGTPAGEVAFLNAHPWLSVALAFLAGMTVSMTTGVLLERIAYRPLRGAPRLVPLISAIGASIFLQNAAQLTFSGVRRTYTNPDVLPRDQGFVLMDTTPPVLLTFTGAFTLALSVVLMVALYLLVQRTRLGRAMRAVAQDKPTAALMGIDVDAVVSRTFAISGVLAGAAGVMWGIHNGIIYHYVGFIPGLKAFTAAVLGGIGNVPGAMVGGLCLGVIESVGPAALGMPYQLKDVLAFLILVLVLIFRPSGILGEVLSEEKV
jgi:branched-chain amino acid transport system permease protein